MVNHQAAEQILRDYRRMEPDGCDTWNPLLSDSELTYRLALFAHVTHALRHADVSTEALTVLDVGCGNGRSTRMYLDLGIRPSQLTGIDLRADAVGSATELHPTISFHVTGAPQRNLGGPWNWIQLTTVMSSIADVRHRRELADEIYAALEPGGYVFYFDLVRANPFAGADEIRPIQLFTAMPVVWSHRLTLRTYNAGCCRDADEGRPRGSKGASKGPGGLRRTLRRSARQARSWTRRQAARVWPSKTHEAMLFRKVGS